MKHSLLLVFPLLPLAAFTQATPQTELVSFVATAEVPRGILLQWTASNEANDARFVVERSADLLLWSAVTELEASGSGADYSDYEAWDPEPLDGIAYYRLAEISQGQTSILSDLFAVRYEQDGEITIAVGAPGRLAVKAANGALTEVQLINNRGQFMTIPVEYFPDRVAMNVELVPAGTYYLCARVDGRPVMRQVYLRTGVHGG